MSSSSTASKLEKEKLKLVQEKCQTLLNDMLRDEDNKYCVDCDAKGPRWASWNLGIFLCIRCAGIHRNLGVHISRVKSVNLDTWTPEQVVTMQQMGNSRARAVYEANMPDSFRRPQTDVALESFIRAKYEHKKYIAQEWVQPTLPKVNWDAEIEESIRKKKEAKKQVTSEINLPSAIPKPKPLVSSNSTTPNTSKLPNPVKSPQPVSASNNSLVEVNGKSKSAPSDDLLGLMTSDDSSASNPNPDPFASPVKSAASTSLSASDELGNIFTSPELPKDNGGSGLKMTKESILSLYGQNSGSTVNPFASPATLYSNQSGTGPVGGPSPGGLFSPYGQQQQPQQQPQQQQQQQQFNPNLMAQGGMNAFASPPQNMSAGLAKDAGMNNFFNLQNDISSQVQQQMHGMNLSSSTFSNFSSGVGGSGGTTFQSTSNNLLGNFASVNNQAGIQAGIASFLGPSGTATPFAPQISQNKNPGPFF